MRTVAVVGASLAGLSAARSLRNRGFDGRLLVIGEEPHRPYDRPPLSKEFLAGKVGEDELALEPDGEDLAAEWLFGARAVRLDRARRAIGLADGTEVRADGIVVATGAAARTLPGADGLAGVHTLRTLDDARALRDDLALGGRLVVIGGGFIGAEVASTAYDLGLDVTVVEAAPTPLAGALGADMGRVVSALHGDHGVRLLCGTGVRGLTGAPGSTACCSTTVAPSPPTPSSSASGRAPASSGWRAPASRSATGSRADPTGAPAWPASSRSATAPPGTTPRRGTPEGGALERGAGTPGHGRRHAAVVGLRGSGRAPAAVLLVRPVRRADPVRRIRGGRGRGGGRGRHCGGPRRPGRLPAGRPSGRRAGDEQAPGVRAMAQAARGPPS